MSVLRIKDENGNWKGIESLKGDKGDKGDAGVGAYDSAVKGGYKGTEEELNEALAMIPDHTKNKSNPHGVTPAQIGAATVEAVTSAQNTANAALPKSGGTVNGSLDIDGSLAVKRSDNNRKARTVVHNNDDKEVDFQNYTDDNNYVSLRVATEAKGIGNALNVTQMKDGAFSSFPVLHTGNKEKIFTFGSEDLTAGSSPLGNGQLHFVYE